MITFRWLGVAGVEITSDKQTLLVDPYLSRVPIWKSYFGRIQPDSAAADKIQRADFILVTHAHFDHILDVPGIVRKTGAKVYGSSNTCRLLTALGVPPEWVKLIKPGNTLSLGEFSVKIFPFEHARVPGYGSGPLPRDLKPPLHARDYRMDYGLCFHISAGGASFLTDPGYTLSALPHTDVLLTQPHHDARYYNPLLDMVKPSTVIPIHWDNLFSHDDTRPFYRPPAFRWPPIRRINLDEFKATILNISQSTKIVIPIRFEEVEMG